jgi:hypothetical protein
MWTVVLQGATYVSTFGSLAYAPSARGLGGVRLAHVLRTSVLGRRAGPYRLRETLTRPIDGGAYLYGMDLRINVRYARAFP